METPHIEPQEHSRNVMPMYLPGSFYALYILTMFSGFPLTSFYKPETGRVTYLHNGPLWVPVTTSRRGSLDT